MQLKRYSFGIDNVSFIDDAYNVYAVEDPKNFSIDFKYEKAEHRGGTNNDVRATKIHTRGAEIKLGTGVINEDLAKILTGGTITSLGTSAASVVTGTASGVNTLYGSTAKICTGITSVILNSPTLVRTDDYYITALAVDAIKVERVNDGKITVTSQALTASNSFTIDSDRGVVIFTGAGAVSLTAGEKAYISTRTAINSVNSKISMDSNKPGKLSLRATVIDNGTQRIINVPVAQPAGSIQGLSASEFVVNDLTMGAEVSSLGELASVITNG